MLRTSWLVQNHMNPPLNVKGMTLHSMAQHEAWDKTHFLLDPCFSAFLLCLITGKLLWNSNCEYLCLIYSLNHEAIKCSDDSTVPINPQSLWFFKINVQIWSLSLQFWQNVIRETVNETKTREACEKNLAHLQLKNMLCFITIWCLSVPLRGKIKLF